MKHLNKFQIVRKRMNEDSELTARGLCRELGIPYTNYKYWETHHYKPSLVAKPPTAPVRKAPEPRQTVSIKIERNTIKYNFHNKLEYIQIPLAEAINMLSDEDRLAVLKDITDQD